ncbi:kinase-like domain-containing protein [Cokeromyces recurvatus]|uniref:kinase-like domain-containing protein n=1 Tax=Cokeromyces recurvatus TaxID=90255 RepID=UPI00221E587B|nr:kinase-like domain-containing protein [Cokeromyces recurvatus]KAI7903455.1 kinase-like domain-containing protein [Cokeromyces recurvatus]
MPKIDLNLVTSTNTKDPKDTPKEKEHRTIREMAIMHLLQHPNICKLKEWIIHEGHYYMFLEYIEGGQLLDYIISHGKLREKLARKFARQIVSALDYCHRNSIVHRDLKIENILITTNEDIKIIDFGLSNIYSPNRLLDTFCGSLYFAAPELLQAKNYNGPEVDVWSFGVVLYVLVCGRVPFDDTNLPALHKKIKEGNVEYPEHLSKDCIDLLSKILVVDPLKRETLSFVIHHPWMNKGYDEPIFNYLPHRTPLTSIDPQVICGMQGFGLGTPDEIEAKLLRIIYSPSYQFAAAQIEQNSLLNQTTTAAATSTTATATAATITTLNSMSKWRRNLSLRKSFKYQKKKKDDPQSLPAMYDPLISIYYLVKERKELDERNRLLESEGYQSPVQLGRSASTSLAKPSIPKQPEILKEVHIQRRKTDRIPPSYRRDILKQHIQQEDWASPKPPEYKSNSITLSQRSKSTAKRHGHTTTSSSLTATNINHHLSSKRKEEEEEEEKEKEKIDNVERGATRDNEDPSLSLLKVRSSSTVAMSRPMTHHSSNDDTGSSIKKKTIRLLRSASLSDKRYRQQKQQSANRVQFSSVEQQQIPSIATQPKSLFNFNRRHLFKVSANDMMTYIQQVTLKLGIQYYIPFPREEPFTLKCVLSDWSRYKKYEIDEDLEPSQPPTEAHFTLTIYQARWARGRLGVKVHEAEEDKTLYKRIHHTIVNELGLLIKSQ